MRFELFIAARYLRAKRRQAVVGLVTMISVLGVAAGVASLIIALAINNGFRQDLQDRLLGSTSHVNLLRVESDGVKDWRPLLDRLSKQPHVVASAPAIYEQVLVSRGPRARGAVLKGMIPSEERRVSDLLNSVKTGSADALEDSGQGTKQEQMQVPNQDPKQVPNQDPKQVPKKVQVQVQVQEQEPNQDQADKSVRSTRASSADSLAAVHDRVAAMPPIVLGKDMAADLGATVNSVVLVTSPQGELTPFGMVPKYIRFRVAGIFDSGFYDYDSSWGFIRLSDAQQLFGLGDVVSVLEFKIDDIYSAPQVAKQIESAAGKGFMATQWMEQNKSLFRALRLERLVTFITIGLIVFVAALNILISLTMMVMEKTKDIAVLMSMGAKKAQIRRIFMLQGVLVGVVGTLLGLILGYGVSWAGAHYRLISLSAEVYSIDYVPFAPHLMDGAIVALIAFAVSFLATLYPSSSAARILPAEALRYE